MKRDISRLILSVLILISFNLSSQEFSILTCDKGDAIYSTFGHSAIRYKDSIKGIDEVYNYGLFDFGDPNFIPKFCNGLLDYKVDKEPFNRFLSQYIYQEREVVEQKLNLTDNQRVKLLNYLEWNILPENQYYRYNFLYENCATKIIDIIEKKCEGIKIIHNYNKESTFRELIHTNAEKTVPLIDWGMDVCLGRYTDTPISKRDFCFLPEYVFKTLNGSINTKTGDYIVSNTEILIQNYENNFQYNTLGSPYFISILLIFFAIFANYYHGKFLKYFSALIFIIVGIGGLIVSYEWFATEHSVTKMNLNIGWLNPLSLVYGFLILINRKSFFLKKMIISILILTLLISLFGIQKLHFGSVIVIITLLILLSEVKIISKLFKE